jgi:hypothetical protein
MSRYDFDPYYQAQTYVAGAERRMAAAALRRQVMPDRPFKPSPRKMAWIFHFWSARPAVR